MSTQLLVDPGLGESDASFNQPVRPRPPPLQDCLRVLRRNIRLTVGITLIFTVTGAAVAFQLTKTYTASATVMIRQGASDPLATSEAQAQRPDDAATETVAVILRSRDLAQMVVQKIGFRAQLQPLSPWRATMCEHAASIIDVSAWRFCSAPLAPSLNDRVAVFAAGLRVEPILRSRAINLFFTADEPDVAARAVNELVAAEQAAEQLESRQQLQQTVDWLETRSIELRDRWLKAERRASEYRTEHGLTQTASGGGAQPLILQQVADANSALAQAQASLSTANARVATLQQAVKSDRSGLMRLSEQPLIVSSATALNELVLQRAKLAQQYGSDFPAVATLSRQIAAAEASLNAQTDSAVQGIKSEAAEKQAQVYALSRTLSELRNRYGDVNGQESELQTLLGEAKADQLSYQTFVSQTQRLTDRSALQQPITASVAHAQPPDRPSFPDIPRLILGSAVFGLVVGAGIAFLREHLGNGFLEISRVSAAVSLPLITTIPVIPVTRWRRRNASVARYVARTPLSQAAEAMRSIISNLSLLHDGHQAVAVTSATSKEGKSVTSLWLATLARQAGYPVLVIDCDLRTGSITSILEGQPGPGLSELLAGKAMLSEVVQRDIETGVDFIPAHQATLAVAAPDPDRVRALLQELKRSYRLIVLDTPPLLACSDTLLFCAAADQTVYLCRWGRTSRGAVYDCLERLRLVQARIAGIALSMVPPRNEVLYSDTLRRRDQLMLRRYYSE